MHVSIPVEQSIEFINISEVSPLISKCQIKVCYIGDSPNRNKTVITKEIATKMAAGLPGSPIVGYFNEETQDFEQHNKAIQFKDGEFALVETTKPYGFVPTDAKIWFQKFIDDGNIEREYLVTEGYIWTGAFPESQRIFENNGNNQSLEIHKESIQGYWTGGINPNSRFFIFNEAIIEKLCILGEDYEPCFEGSQIKSQFALEEEFAQLKNTMFSMMDELKTALNKGGSTTSMSQELNNPSVAEGVVENANTDPTIATIGDFAKSEDEKNKNKENQDNSDKDTSKETENKKEGQEPEDKSKEKEKEDDKKSKYSLEDVVEYVQLKADYDTLVEKYSTLEQENANLTAELQPLKEFKLGAERDKKQEMINSFYMLSDEDKKDVVENIDTYSLNDIEAQLAVICVRNKVSFSLEDENKESDPAMTFSLNNSDIADSTPDWIKAVQATASSM